MPTPLRPLQELLADEIGDILTFGRNRAAVEGVLRAAAENLSRRELEYDDHNEKLEESVHSSSARYVAAWREELAEIFHANRKPAAEHRQEPASVVERIRRGILEDLREKFEVFLSRANPESQVFLSRVLEFHDGAVEGRSCFDQLVIAEAAYFALNHRDGLTFNYVRVPDYWLPVVEILLDLLKKAEGKLRAA